MLFLIALYTQSVTVDGSSLNWELVKGVMLTLSTTGVLAALGLLVNLRDTVRDIKRELFGHDGTNGIKSTVTEHNSRLDRIEDRNLKIDAVTQAELDYHGPERRHGGRRLRDIIGEEASHRDPHRREGE